MLYQNYSEIPSFNPDAERDSVGQKFTLNFSRDMLRRGTPEALTFDLVVEDRGPIGTENPPLQAGLAAGSIVPTAATWGDFDLGITQAYIRQNLMGNKVQYTIGKIFAPNFVNAYPFFDDNRQFLNQAFSTSPTIASPLRGFGAVATVYPTENNLYVLGGIYSANSSDTGFTLDEVFDTGELFYQLEVGWSALARSGVPVQARGPMDSNNVHITGWYKDSQPDQANVTLQPQARGLAFNANWMVGDNLMWFLRAGASEGWVNDRAVSAGFGWRPSTEYSDLFGFGIGWVRPEHRDRDGRGLPARAVECRDLLPLPRHAEPRDHAGPPVHQQSVAEPGSRLALGRKPARARHVLTRGLSSPALWETDAQRSWQ